MASIVAESVPRLAGGDKLARIEFLCRWESHPEIKNANQSSFLNQKHQSPSKHWLPPTWPTSTWPSRFS